MQNLEHLRILPVIFPIYHSLGSSLGNALQQEQPHLRKKIPLGHYFRLHQCSVDAAESMPGK